MTDSNKPLVGMKNKRSLYLVAFTLFSFAIILGCEEIYEPITVTGQVVDSNSLNGVPNATVSIISPPELSAQTVSDGNGEYFFEEVAVDSVVDLTIQAEKEGFSTESITVLAAPERQLVVPELRITDQNAGGDGDITGAVGGAASIILTNLSSPILNITETGGNVNSSFTFEVQDSSGRAIDAANSTDVFFEIVEGPNGGESITPEIVQSDANGIVSSNIFAGNIAGNVKIEARIERPEYGLTIRSKPILLTIHGGFPDAAHFSIAAEIFNFEAFSINGNRDEITVIVGDKYSNPVKPETPVYFNTTGGVIQGSGTTTSDGEVSVDLISGNPRPSDQYATVRAYTYDENDNEISREITVLFSGPPRTNRIQVSPTTFDIPNKGGQSFSMTLTDINGNPLPYDTSVTITPSEGMAVSGESNFNIPNALFGGPGVTQFNFTIQDNDEEDTGDQEVSFVIEVETPGGFSATKTISGTKGKAAF